MILAVKSAGASLVYSEDFAHGQVYDGVRVENPFLILAAEGSGVICSLVSTGEEAE